MGSSTYNTLINLKGTATDSQFVSSLQLKLFDRKCCDDFSVGQNTLSLQKT